jgi:hypothetical protein
MSKNYIFINKSEQELYSTLHKIYLNQLLIIHECGNNNIQLIEPDKDVM